jgi:predicted Ser/Thr protein kinase
VLATGTEIGGYRIEGLLGRGGMGVVYEATQLSLNRTVALKLLAADLSEDPAFRERFRREGRIQAGIDHGHIVTIFEAGEFDEGLFIAMRLIRGPNLKQLIRSGELDALRTVRLLNPIADALDTAHESGLIHRDVKPQNILVGRRDHAYLADFGLTKALGDTAVTQTGQLMGTLDYVAPEQIRGEAAGAAADVYALTCVAFECLTGTPPFQKPSEAATLYAHMSEPPPAVAGQVPGAGPELDEWIARGLAKSPHERPETALDLLTGMEEALNALNGTGGVRAIPAAPAAAAAASAPPAPPPPAAPAAPAVPSGGTELIAPQGTPTRGDLRRDWSPEPVAVEAPPPRARRALPAKGLLAAGVGAGVVAALAGFLIGNSGNDEPAPSAGPRVGSDAVALQAPAGWKRADPQQIPGLRLGDPVAVRRGNATVVAGVVDGSGKALLPAAFEERLRTRPSVDGTVKLGDLEAQRLEPVDPRGKTRPMTLFVAPLEHKVAAVACLDGTPAAACGAIADSLELTGDDKGRPLGPSAGYAKPLRAVVSRLDRQRSKAQRALRRSGTPVGQARAAGDVAFAYQRAARALAPLVPGPLELRAHRRLRRALADGYVSYAKLSGAAGAGRRSSYASARRAAVAADTAVRRALADLRELGYRAG